MYCMSGGKQVWGSMAGPSVHQQNGRSTVVLGANCVLSIVLPSLLWDCAAGNLLGCWGAGMLTPSAKPPMLWCCSGCLSFWNGPEVANGGLREFGLSKSDPFPPSPWRYLPTLCTYKWSSSLGSRTTLQWL